MKVKDCVLIQPFTCRESENVVDVAKKLRGTSLRHIFVVDKKDYPTGVISVIDINNRIVAEGKDPNKVKAKTIMTKPVDVVKLGEDAKKLAKSMADKQRVMNPVVDNNKKIIGIITLTQLLK